MVQKTRFGVGFSATAGGSGVLLSSWEKLTLCLAVELVLVYYLAVPKKTMVAYPFSLDTKSKIKVPQMRRKTTPALHLKCTNQLWRAGQGILSMSSVIIYY